MTNLGIYIHIPFCVSKCSYCNFYSFCSNEALKDKYCESLIKELEKWGAEISRPISSVYIGGGTPTAMNGKRLKKILDAVNTNFRVINNAEITVEGNPADDYSALAPILKKSGCNRFSLGVQSANEAELAVLGRRHNNTDVKKAIEELRKNGINNISVDLMLGLPESNLMELEKSIAFAVSLGVEHISAYILKLEEGTPLYDKNIPLPDDDAISDQYLFLCDKLKAAGYSHYEISNFCKDGFHSKHNSAYWECKEYLGFGPSAHSFYEGKRFYYKNDLTEYLASPCPVPDGEGGNKEEYIMLGLRLKKGILITELPENALKRAEKLQENELCDIIDGRISLTDKGMLVSNQIINYFLEELV